MIRGQAPVDSNDIIARVFERNMRFMDVIKKYHIFGNVRCWMQTMEWQKPGVPHSHIFIRLHGIIYPNQIDQVT